MVNYALAAGTQIESLRVNTATGLTLTGNAFSKTITGNSGNDTLTGGTSNDTITGGAGNDSLTGGAGDDTLDGGTGNDAMAGGTGNDTYFVDSAADVVTENALEGTADTIMASASYSLAVAAEVNAQVETLRVNTSTTTGLTLTGNAFSHTIIGGTGNDTLTGGTGNDTITGGAGNDTYVVDSAADVVTENAGEGTDTIKTTLTSYNLLTAGTNVENLTFTGAGNFTGTGNTLANVITGGAGNDTLDGGAGADTMIGGAGNDTYFVDNVGDKITEAFNAGTDTVNTTLNTYALDNGNTLDNLTFIGGSGSFNGTGNGLANILTGGAGNDILNGGNGNDTLIGGAGADSLTGGGGNDVFNLFKSDDNGDLITDFTRGSDFINFFNYGAGAALVKGAVGGGATTYTVQVGGVTQDTFKLNGNITLAATDFRFN
jgi:Ca2+-binding RTX toxin-like protein